MPMSSAPISFQHGPKLKHQTSATPSYSSPPVIHTQGDSHLDNFLLDRTRVVAVSRDGLVDSHSHSVILQHDNTFIPTILESSHSFVGTVSPSLPLSSSTPGPLPLFRTQPRLSPDALTGLGLALPGADLDSLSIFESATAPLWSDAGLRHHRPRRTRALTQTPHNRRAIMADVHSPPGSPPDLSESRSSKSSSYGSGLSREDDFADEVTNFEDIGLHDDGRPSHLSTASPSWQAPESIGRAPYFTSKRSKMPEPRRVKGRTDDGPRSAGLIGLKRGVTSPSMTTIVEIRPRSTSPVKQLSRSASIASFTQPGPLGETSPRPSLASTSRRGSWVPRKTIKEIEAEYNESDDELPDDASLWNVPISPFPFADRSPLSSKSGSPDRATSRHSPQPVPLEHVRSAPVCQQPRTGSLGKPMPRQRPLPRSSSHHVFSSQSTSQRPYTSLGRTGRTKSWNTAMDDLSVEARIISQNLEAHAELQAGSGDEKWTPSAPQRSSAPGAIQLPPVQRGTLDFMPCSKEKEAVLSRTRPSWLPPKDPKEEARHLREYQRMMAASREAEKTRELQAKKARTTTDDTQTRLNRIWDYYVAPDTDITTIDRRVDGLCWRGVPSRTRGKVWRRRVGNPLALTPKTFEKAIERAAEVKAKDWQSLDGVEKAMVSWFSEIEKDAETAFPDLRFFQPGGPLRQDLINLCEAHVCYRGDVGYFYGLQLVAAMILLQVPDAAEAFILLENCLNSPVPLSFHTQDPAATQRTYMKVITMLGIKAPRLHDYLFNHPEQGGLGFVGEEVLEPMFRTMFSNGLDIDRLCRVWDVWVFEGDNTLIRTAVALLSSLQVQILDAHGDLHLKRRNIQEMLGWGPFNRSSGGGYWRLAGDDQVLMDEVSAAGRLDYTGR